MSQPDCTVHELHMRCPCTVACAVHELSMPGSCTVLCTFMDCQCAVHALFCNWLGARHFRARLHSSRTAHALSMICPCSLHRTVYARFMYHGCTVCAHTDMVFFSLYMPMVGPSVFCAHHRTVCFLRTTAVDLCVISLFSELICAFSAQNHSVLGMGYVVLLVFSLLSPARAGTVLGDSRIHIAYPMPCPVTT